MRNFTLTLVSGLVIAGSANALTCINDYGGTSSCTNANPAGDCTTLGYSKDNVSGCEHYLYCPFDTAYKRCVKEGCGDGFAKDVSGCGKSGDKGWLLIKTSGSECGLCSAKQCPNPERPKNTLSCSSDECLAETGNYFGDTPCAVCTTLCCKDGYAKVPSDCGTTGEQGWELDMFALGTSDGCKKCKARSCPTGYSPENTGGTSLACFPNHVMLYNGYSGNNRCYKCQKCPTGYATQDSHCEDGYAVNKSIHHSTYAGCYKCEMKPCSTGYAKTAADCGSTGATGWTLGSTTDPMNAQCKLCVANTCDGYSASKQSVNDCTSIGHPEGWNFSSCTSGDGIKGKCTAKTCEDHGLKSAKPSVYKQVNKYLGDSLRTCYQAGSCGEINKELACALVPNCACAGKETIYPPAGYEGKCSDNWVCIETGTPGIPPRCSGTYESYYECW